MSQEYAGKTALITGASSGIGETFARTLAARGMNLVLAARSAGKLQALGDALAGQYGVQVRPVAADLSRPGAAGKLYADVAALGAAVDWLVNNAGVSATGAFDELPLQRQSDMIQLNVTALTELTHLFLPQLLERKGALINIASLAAFQPDPYFAVYGGTKAYVLSFTEALWAEYRGRGLKVLAVCPGITQTNIIGSFDEQTQRKVATAARFGLVMSAETVVQQSLKALEDGRSHIVNGLLNRLTAQLPRVAPRSLLARLNALMMKS